MTVPWLFDNQPLPPPNTANEDGIVAVGGALSVPRLREAYGQGIFPWPHEDLPMLWFSPDPRFVIHLDSPTAPKSLLKKLKSTTLHITMDTQFERVVRHCANVPRPDQNGTWITQDILDAYLELHQEGIAHSVEAWDGNTLVGGLYGVSLGGCFFGESMFALQPEASKIAFATFISQLGDWQFDLIDCQIHTDHLARFGGVFMPRSDYCGAIKESQIHNSTRKGKWDMTQTPLDAHRFFKSR